MWTCPNCGRTFKNTNQPHSCKSVPLEEHFKGKPLARALFDTLLERITSQAGPCRIISLPCCVHLFGHYDFLAALPKKNRLEVRFTANREMTGPRIQACVPMSAKVFKICLDLFTEQDINRELMDWLVESYQMKG
jgi:hypothetical protein